MWCRSRGPVCRLIYYHRRDGRAGSTTEVQWTDGSSLRYCERYWASDRWCIHESCIVEMVVSRIAMLDLTSRLTYHLSFYINLPIGAVSTLVILIFFPLRSAPLTRPNWRKLLGEMDLPGLTLIVGAVVCFTLAMQWGGISKAWSSGPVVGTLVGFIVMSILFVVIQWKSGERAMVVGRIFKRRTIAVGSAFSFL